MYILDTDHITLLEHGCSVAATRILEHMTDMRDRDVATTIISFEEQTRGWLTYLARAKSVAQQVEAYARLRRMLENYRNIPILDFDSVAAIEFQRLKKSNVRIGTMDLKIAAIALANNATVVSRNLSDFQKVSGLPVEDWTI